jgi:hypothetical protein
MRFLRMSLVIAAALTMAACASKSSSNSASQSSAAATTAAEPSAAGSMGAAATTAEPSAAGSMAAAATAAPAGEIPSYPGAVTQASGSSNNMGESASGTVMITDDSFDKVYAWYQQHMPAGSEKSHMTAPVQSAIFIIGEPSSGQKSVTITTSGGKTMITIGNVKTQ